MHTCPCWYQNNATPSVVSHQSNAVSNSLTRSIQKNQPKTPYQHASHETKQTTTPHHTSTNRQTDKPPTYHLTLLPDFDSFFTFFTGLAVSPPPSLLFFDPLPPLPLPPSSLCPFSTSPKISPPSSATTTSLNISFNALTPCSTTADGILTSNASRSPIPLLPSSSPPLLLLLFPLLCCCFALFASARTGCFRPSADATTASNTSSNRSHRPPRRSSCASFRIRSVQPRRWSELRSVAWRSSSAGVLVRCWRRSDSRSVVVVVVDVVGWLGEEEEGIVGFWGLESWGWCSVV